ncbi:MAG: hypothetical protein AAF387_22620, partial [Pseudomonadota bacterium]
MATTTITVTTATDGLDFQDDLISLREAIQIYAVQNAEAGNDSEIVFDIQDGSGSTIVLDSGGGALQVSTNLTIDGGDDGITIDAAGSASNPNRVFDIEGTKDEQIDVGLSSLTITGGQTTGNLSNGAGAGIFAEYTDLTIDSSTITGNSTSGKSADGAGIFASYSNLTVTDTVVSGNSTTGNQASGAGIALLNSGLDLAESTIERNNTYGRSAFGGGIWANYSTDEQSGQILIARSTIDNNNTTGQNSSGGGIDLSNVQNFGFEYSTLSNNSISTGGGGGLSVYGSSALISNS